MNKIIEQYCEEQCIKKAIEIDGKTTLAIKPKPKYCPKWLYKKIIKDTIEIINLK